jgi:5-methylcytosine-specific restriction enzyme subunit McrC
VSYEVLELPEEELVNVPSASLSDSNALALNESGKFEVQAPSALNDFTYGIRSKGWVGNIPIGEDLLIRVVPKVPVSNLFRMLEVAYSLRSFRIFDGETGIQSVEDLYERIVSILSRRVLDRARKGLYRSYVSETDELPYVRGRIDPVATALNKVKGIARASCRYDEHTADLNENRILLWTLHQVRRQALRQARVRRELDSARRALAGTITLEPRRASHCVGLLYNRLNSDYAPMHGLCRFILEQTGPGIDQGDRTFVPFELNMPQLFETFVAEWLRANPPDAATVRCHHNARLDANFKMAINVDIVLLDKATDRPIAVLDTKYKVHEQPTEADIYQIAFYASELRVSRAILIYPSSLTRSLRINHGKHTKLESLTFDISQPLETAGPEFIHDLEKRLSAGYLYYSRCFCFRGGYSVLWYFCLVITRSNNRGGDHGAKTTAAEQGTSACFLYRADYRLGLELQLRRQFRCLQGHEIQRA